MRTAAVRAGTFRIASTRIPRTRPELRQIPSVQVAANSADAGDQSDQDGRVSGPLGVSFHCGAVDEALLKIIQTLDYPVLATDDGHNSSQPPCPNFNLGREMRFGTSDRRLSETPHAPPLRD